MSKSVTERYEEAMHGVQTGIAIGMQIDGTSTTPKHLRVGVDSCMVTNRAMAELLIAKGVITKDEYLEAVARAAEKERSEWEDRLSEHLGKTVTLG